MSLGYTPESPPLPYAWTRLSSYEKGLIIRQLQKDPPWRECHPAWRGLVPNDRRRVLDHLLDVGSLAQMPTYPDAAPYYVRGDEGQARAERILVAMKSQISTGRYSLYPPPNGGNRMLPSIYVHLREKWLKATGVFVEVDSMNRGHVENTLKLLQESNGNIVARATDLLGRMANHFRNQPKICEALEALCLQMQQVDVDDMYPIYGPLAERAEPEGPEDLLKIIQSGDWSEDELFEPGLDGRDW